MTVEEIHLEGGIIIEIAGNADEARIDMLTMPDGTTVCPKREE